MKLVLSFLMLAWLLSGCADMQKNQARGFLDWDQVVQGPDGTVLCDQPYCK